MRATCASRKRGARSAASRTGCAVRPDRRGWTAFHSAGAQAAETKPSHVDYLLRFVIERSIDDNQRGIVARIDAVERTLGALTRPWRAESPIALARELRL